MKLLNFLHKFKPAPAPAPAADPEHVSAGLLAACGRSHERARRHQQWMRDVVPADLTWSYAKAVTLCKEDDDESFRQFLDAMRGQADGSRRIGLFLECIQNGVKAPLAGDHATALAALHGNPEQIKKRYLGLLANTKARDKAQVLRAVQMLANSPDAAAELTTLGDLRRVTPSMQQAVDDLAVVRNASAQHQAPYGEACELAKQARLADPARYGHIKTYGELEPVMQFVLSAPDAAQRTARQKAISKLATAYTNWGQAAALRASWLALGQPLENSDIEKHYLGISQLLKTDDHALLLTFCNRLQGLPAAAWGNAFTLLKQALALPGERDPHALADILEWAGQRADPAAALGQASKLLEASRHAALAAADARTLDAVAQQHGHVAPDEIARHIAALRVADPARGSGNVASQGGLFGSLDAPLAYVLAPHTEKERAARLDELKGWCVEGRNAADAVVLRKALSSATVPPELARSWRAMTAWHKHYADTGLCRVLPLLSSSRYPMVTWRTFERLTHPFGPNQAAADLPAVLATSRQQGLDVLEVADLAHAIRKIDSKALAIHCADLGPVLDAIAGADTADERSSRLEAYRQLYSVEGGTLGALEDLDHVLRARRPHEKLGAVLGDFIKVRYHATPEQRNAVHELFDRVRAEPPPRHWWNKFRPHGMVWRLFRIEANADSVRDYARALDQHRMPQESHAEAFKRLQGLVKGSMHGKREDVLAAFRAPTEPFASQNTAPHEKARQIAELVSSTGSAHGAARVWKLMAEAPTPEECSARRDGFKACLQHTPGNLVGAQQLYDALTANLGPDERIAPRLEQMQAWMARKKAPDMVAAVLEHLSHWREQPPASQQRIESVFERAHNADEARQLQARLLVRPHGEEVAARAERLAACLEQKKKLKDALDMFDRNDHEQRP